MRFDLDLAWIDRQLHCDSSPMDLSVIFVQPFAHNQKHTPKPFCLFPLRFHAFTANSMEWHDVFL